MPPLEWPYLHTGSQLNIIFSQAPILLVPSHQPLLPPSIPPSPSTVAVAVTKHNGWKDQEEESSNHGHLLGDGGVVQWNLGKQTDKWKKNRTKQD